MYRTFALGFLLALATAPSWAHGVDGSAVVGGAMGGGVGAAVGSMAGGRDGAIVGSALGAAAGTAIATREQPYAVYVEEHRHHDNGLHRGWYRHHHHEDD